MLVGKVMRAWIFFVLASLGNAIEKRNWLNATFAAMQQVEQYLKTTDSIYYVYQGTKATDPMKRDGEERRRDTFKCPHMRIRMEETTPHGYKSRWVTRVFSTKFSVSKLRTLAKRKTYAKNDGPQEPLLSDVRRPLQQGRLFICFRYLQKHNTHEDELNTVN
uniref:Putative secreted protein n=1 Tax=Ixodes ricinus TaxID=34613 RepID=A0A6B0UXG1_IXORI